MQWNVISTAVAAVVFFLNSAVAFAEPAPGAQGGVTPFIPLILIFGIFYFLILRPQQKKQKEQQVFLSNLKRGDMVITNAGIIGTIRTLNEKFVTLEVDEGVCIKILRGQIAESAANLNKEESKAKGGLLASTQDEKK